MGFIINFLLTILFIVLFTAGILGLKALKLWIKREEIKPWFDGLFTKEGLKKIGSRVFTTTWLTLTVYIILIPVLWIITASLTEGKSLSNVPFIPFIPRWMGNPFASISWWFDKMGTWAASQKSIAQFVTLFTYKSNPSNAMPDFIKSFLTSLQIAVITTIIVVTLSVLVGFAFARFKFKGKKKALLTMMGLQMFPSFMGILALFLLFKTFGWVDQPLYLAIVYGAGAIPYNTFLVRGFFRNIPRSLDEAAAIDGATNMQTIWKVLIPLAVPIIGFIAVSAFMGPWLDFILPSQLSPNNKTVAVWLYDLIKDIRGVQYNPLLFMAGAMVLVVPIMAVQIYMQKFVISGLTAGADKG